MAVVSGNNSLLYQPLFAERDLLGLRYKKANDEALWGDVDGMLVRRLRRKSRSLVALDMIFSPFYFYVHN